MTEPDNDRKQDVGTHSSRHTNIALRLLDLCLPRACCVCGQRLSAGELMVCAGCNLRLPRTGYALCPYDNDMARCFYHLLPAERVAAWLFHEHGSEAARAIYAMKYGGMAHYGECYGRLAAQEMSPCGFFEGVDCIVPVPLAPARERQRGYNQSCLIAEGLSQVTGLPVTTKAVERTTWHGSQTRLGREERIANVRDAFRLRDGSLVSGRHVLLVDDICTSGATLEACAGELLKAGNVTLSLFAVAFAGQRYDNPATVKEPEKHP